MAIRIFIDQGHNPGGINGGAEGNGLREQDVTYSVGQLLKGYLERDPRFAVKLSRDTPGTILGTDNASSLWERVRAANAWPADFFLSIHCNSGRDPARSGSEVYVYRADSQSYWLARHILNGLTAEAGTGNNGVWVDPSLYVLRQTAMPADLIELGYLTSGADAEKLREKQGRFALGIFRGLLSYFGFSRG